MTDAAPTVPRATYRLQLSADFDLDAAAAQVGYLAALGISHVYLSPCFAARRGSTHGYDVIDHNRINPELGGEAAYERLVAALQSAGLHILQDFVPNHVGIGGSRNLWWLDILEWGEGSQFARAFDVQWWPEQPGMAGRVLVPFLGDQYGAVLESGGLPLRVDAGDGSLSVWLEGGHRLPLRPQDYATALAACSAELDGLPERFGSLPPTSPDTQQRARQLKDEFAQRLREPGVAAAVEATLRTLNGEPGDPRSFDALDALLNRQHWRATSWRVAAHDINYRRFFNINELAGLRVEEPAVFAAVHRLVLEQLQAGVVDALRIDHVDGLYDPAGYCRRLADSADRPFYLVVEKILASHEQLPDWPVAGTTGYEFAMLRHRCLRGRQCGRCFLEAVSAVHGLHGFFRPAGGGLQTPRHAERNGRRTDCAGPRGARHRAARSPQSRLHAQRPAGGDPRDRRALPRVPNLHFSRRRERDRPPPRAVGDGALREQHCQRRIPA